MTDTVKAVPTTGTLLQAVPKSTAANEVVVDPVPGVVPPPHAAVPLKIVNGTEGSVNPLAIQ